MGYLSCLHKSGILSLASCGFRRLIATKARLLKRFIDRVSASKNVTRYTPASPVTVAKSAPSPPPSPPAESHLRYYTWAELMQRVFKIDVLECPRCRGRLRILAAIHPPDAARRTAAKHVHRIELKLKSSRNSRNSLSPQNRRPAVSSGMIHLPAVASLNTPA